jgi:hypothetical protein
MIPVALKNDIINYRDIKIAQQALFGFTRMELVRQASLELEKLKAEQPQTPLR